MQVLIFEYWVLDGDVDHIFGRMLPRGVHAIFWDGRLLRLDLLLLLTLLLLLKVLLMDRGLII